MSRVSYRAVKSDIVARIRSGEWPPGTLVPTEAVLAGNFGCARGTVNRALRELAREGVVERRRRAGTRVAPQRRRESLISIPQVHRQIADSGAVYRYERIERRQRPCPASLARHLGITAGAPMLYLRCRHWADQRPFQLEDRWISLAAVPEARRESFSARGPNEWLIEVKPLSDAAHTLYARPASDGEAQLLEIADAEPLFIIERQTALDGQPITWVRLMHPAAGFRLQESTVSDEDV